VRRAAAVLAAVLLPLAVLLALATASPAHAAPAAPPAAVAVAAPAAPAGSAFYDQGDPQGFYLNLWNGTVAVDAYGGVTYNDYIQAVSIGGGQFQLVNDVNGGASCVGDWEGLQGDARAAGDGYCPSTGTAGWGTIFTLGPSCGNGYNLYRNNHWTKYVGFSNSNGSAVYLNTGGTCLKQQDPPGTPAVTTSPSSAPASGSPAALTAAVTRTVSAAGIFGPCNGLEDGEVRDFGGNLYVCRYVPGFGGYYWYGPIDQSCGAAPALVLAGKPEARIC
jgi:hypothetical protein